MKMAVMSDRHIVFLSHIDLNLYLFRRPIMQELMKRHWRVTALTPDGVYAPRFQEDGIVHVPYKLSRQGMNPAQELGVVWDLWMTLRRLSPDLVHTFTVKPNIYGTIAAYLAGVPVIVNSVTGLGSFFIDKAPWNPIRTLILRFYKLICTRTDMVIFQNTDDLRFFLENRLVAAKKTYVMRGSGVDLERFCPTRFSEEDRAKLRSTFGISPTAIVVTLVARLIWDKGVREFCECARHVREKYRHKVAFLLVGDYYDGNPRAVPPAYIESVTTHGDIVFTGWRDDIPAVLNATDIVVLPSSREGLPVSLQEALAMRKAIVTTDTTGCREIVNNGWNGFLVPVQDVEALVQAVSTLICDADLREQMGKRSRKKAEAEFDVRAICHHHIALYEKLLAERLSASACKSHVSPQ
jgi:N,N'-diacetylbacillosaminyl-diphospho-undecaprenol alpha-1,3-N-acetylgalactosaminyltransferase